MASNSLKVSPTRWLFLVSSCRDNYTFALDTALYAHLSWFLESDCEPKMLLLAVVWDYLPCSCLQCQSSRFRNICRVFEVGHDICFRDCFLWSMHVERLCL